MWGHCTPFLTPHAPPSPRFCRKMLLPPPRKTHNFPLSYFHTVFWFCKYWWVYGYSGGKHPTKDSFTKKMLFYHWIGVGAPLTHWPKEHIYSKESASKLQRKNDFLLKICNLCIRGWGYFPPEWGGDIFLHPPYKSKYITNLTYFSTQFFT